MQAGHDPTRLEYGEEPELNPDASPDIVHESVVIDLNSETEIKSAFDLPDDQASQVSGNADDAHEPVDNDDPQD